MNHISVSDLPAEEPALTHCTPETCVNAQSRPAWKIRSLSHCRRKVPPPAAATALLRLLYYDKPVHTQLCFAALGGHSQCPPCQHSSPTKAAGIQFCE